MLENWLKPVNSKILDGNSNPSSFFGHMMIHDQGGIPSLEDTKIVLLGIGDESDFVRKQLYQLTWHFGNMSIADIGNVRKEDDQFITQILKELIDSQIFPIILGGSKTKVLPQFLAHKDIRKFSNIAVISEHIPFHHQKKEDVFFINPLINAYQDHIFNLSFLAYQRHFCDPDLLEHLLQKKIDSLRLGTIKADIEEAEPLIRDADVIFFGMDSIKASEFPAVNQPSPNGITANEACQICRYAGMSDKLESISLSGYYPKYDIQNQGSQILAQMIWYFIDGFHNRKRDYPVTNTGMTEYVVHYKDLDYQLTFWKSNKSGRWWMQIPIKRKRDMGRHKLVPCSYKDYKQSCSGELPERLLMALERLS